MSTDTTAPGALRRRLEHEWRLFSTAMPSCKAWVCPRAPHPVWRVSITGPTGGPYAGCTLWLRVRFPREYPFRPPCVRLENGVRHCNADRSTGQVCLAALKDGWCPGVTVAAVVASIRELLESPNPYDPADPELADAFFGDQERYTRLVEASLGQGRT